MTPTLRALVTGATGGIGVQVAQVLLENGWDVVRPTREDLDLADESSIRAFFEKDNAFDGLVLNAGINLLGKVEQLDLDSFRLVQEVNLVSSFMVLQHVLPGMRERKFGRVVAISSLYAERARAGRVAYSVSKAGLNALVRSVVAEFSPFGVLANVVQPGFVDTPLTRRNNSEEEIQVILQRIPVGELAEPRSIADSVAYLLSPNNHYITGQILNIDGGWECL